MNHTGLKKILEDHKLWLDSYARKGERANLKGADLRDIDLTGVNLECAHLEGVNLEGAYLQYANLKNAYIFGASLKDADLQGADLEGADLSDADLKNANLKDANLQYVDLRCVNLEGADLQGANLEGADLRCAELSGADLKNAKLPPSLDNLPEGELIGYKKVKGCIVKLKILADSKRSRATSNKCRCDKALVLAIENLDGTDSGLTQIINYIFTPTTYEVGAIVYADSWDEDRWNECSHGIHFFLERQKAVNW